MELLLARYSSDENATLGLIFVEGSGNGWDLKCFTCEDEYRQDKIRGETRIPAGRYEVTLRTEGGMHGRYGARFPQMHHGMLWIRNVPDFEWIYFHIGNDEDDTYGCVLWGMDRRERERTVQNSRRAYEILYPLISDRLLDGYAVHLNVIDLDQGFIGSLGGRIEGETS